MQHTLGICWPPSPSKWIHQQAIAELIRKFPLKWNFYVGGHNGVASRYFHDVNIYCWINAIEWQRPRQTLASEELTQTDWALNVEICLRRLTAVLPGRLINHVVAFAISSGNVKILEIETQGTCPCSRAQECKKWNGNGRCSRHMIVQSLNLILASSLRSWLQMVGVSFNFIRGNWPKIII